MKLSVKVQDQNQNQKKDPNENPLLLRAKIPITVFGLPFLTGLVAAERPSDLTLSLRSNFTAGPSLKLSYNPTAAGGTNTGASASAAPLTLTLRSGLSLSGSPNNSPLIISAHFSFSPQNPNPNPTFSLQFKPRFGDFSFHKTTVSHPTPSPNPSTNPSTNGSFEFVPLERPLAWKDFKMESATKDSILSGIGVMAKTALPVTKNVAVNLRWGVNFPAEFGKQMPILSVNKIKIERIEDLKEENEVSEKKKGNDLEMLKGMYSWMRREVADLETENRELKNKLEEVHTFGSLARNNHNHNYTSSERRKSPAPVESSGGFEKWKKNKNGAEDNGKKNVSASSISAIDMENELQKAIMAAST